MVRKIIIAGSLVTMSVSTPAFAFPNEASIMKWFGKWSGWSDRSPGGTRPCEQMGSCDPKK